jgi:hypothetical protein
MNKINSEDLNNLAYCFSIIDLTNFDFMEISERRAALENLTNISCLLNEEDIKGLHEEICPLFFRNLKMAIDNIGLTMKQKSVVDEIVLELSYYAGLVIKLSNKLNKSF